MSSLPIEWKDGYFPRDDKPAVHLCTIARQIVAIMEQPGDGRKATYSPCDNVLATIRIETNTSAYGTWDRCYVNDKWAGNRYGAVEEYVRLIRKADVHITLD